MTSLSRQIAAVEALIAIFEVRTQKPKSREQQAMIAADAKAALETLRTVKS